ncbi:MAG: hypothetical protein NTW91_08100, partial [Verrucomicrobia bacterium]|nr:hypothetical protein [Verrucomicrobiota bacterium]
QYAYQADGSLSAVVTYYTTSGQLDPSQSPFANSFNLTEGGNDGNSSLTAPDGYSLDGGVQVLMDGTSLALGFSSDGSKTPVLVNYNADGSINTLFGNNGIIIGNPGTDYQYTYQDSNSGEIVFKQYANQADGSISEVDTYYTTTGQLDTSNPPFATTIIPDSILTDETDPSNFYTNLADIPFDAVSLVTPRVMYDVVGGVTDRFVTQSTEAVAISSEVTQNSGSSSVGSDINLGTVTNVDTFLISRLPDNNVVSPLGFTTPSSILASSFSAKSETDLETSENTILQFVQSSPSSGIANVSALKLAAASATFKTSRNSDESRDSDLMESTDQTETPFSVFSKDGTPSSLKSSDSVEQEALPHVSADEKLMSDEELISSLLAEA